jgi:predicted XRE-type DNA-binding protein
MKALGLKLMPQRVGVQRRAAANAGSGSRKSRRPAMARVTKGNVFEDLGFSREESADLAMKVQLALEVRKFMQRQRLTQVKAAEFFRVPGPKISNILANKLDGITIDDIVRMLGKTGGKLTCSFCQPAKRVAAAIVKGQLAA